MGAAGPLRRTPPLPDVLSSGASEPWPGDLTGPGHQVPARSPVSMSQRCHLPSKRQGVNVWRLGHRRRPPHALRGPSASRRVVLRPLALGPASWPGLRHAADTLPAPLTPRDVTAGAMQPAARADVRGPRELGPTCALRVGLPSPLHRPGRPAWFSLRGALASPFLVAPDSFGGGGFSPISCVKSRRESNVRGPEVGGATCPPRPGTWPPAHRSLSYTATDHPWESGGGGSPQRRPGKDASGLSPSRSSFLTPALPR